MLQNGFEVIVIDNLSNSTKESLNRVQKITGKKVHSGHSRVTTN